MTYHAQFTIQSAFLTFFSVLIVKLSCRENCACVTVGHAIGRMGFLNEWYYIFAWLLDGKACKLYNVLFWQYFETGMLCHGHLMPLKGCTPNWQLTPRQAPARLPLQYAQTTQPYAYIYENYNHGKQCQHPQSFVTLPHKQYCMASIMTHDPHRSFLVL